MMHLTWLQNIWILYVITMITTTVYLIMENRNPTKTLAWMLVIVAIPIVGILLYGLFGVPFQRDRIHLKLYDSGFLPVSLSKPFERDIQNTKQFLETLPSQYKKWVTLVLKSIRSPITSSNDVELFHEGHAAFDSIKQLLRSATHHIHLQFYIIRDDKLGNEIKSILIKKALEGVQIRLLYDKIGCLFLKKAYIQDLKKAGVKTAEFLPLFSPKFGNRINFRSHRKIIVVDGLVGYLGGMNVGDEYLGKSELGYWRDYMMKLQGDSVKYLQLVFVKDWSIASTEEVDWDQNYFHEVDRLQSISATQKQAIQIVESGPSSDWHSTWQTYFSLLSNANESIWMLTPYLIPDQSIRMALVTAALSGVDVRIIVPHRPDHKIVYYATRSYFDELLRAGVRIFEYTKGFIHAKSILVDHRVASVGTANVDVRSFSYNFEVNALFYEGSVASELKQTFLRDQEDCQEVILAEFEQRPKKAKLLESLTRLLSPLM